MASQAGSQAGSHLPGDSTTSQAVSAISWEGSSLVASQAGSQAGSHLPGDSTSSQASSAVPPNNISAREGPSLAGNNPSTQAGSHAVPHLPGDSPSSQASSAVPLITLLQGKVLPRQAITPQLRQAGR